MYLTTLLFGAYIPEGDAAAYAWNVDVYFPGTARLYADAYAEKIRSHLPVQFCGRLCVWRTDGSSRALDYTSSGKSAAPCAVLCSELSDSLLRHRAFEPLQAPDCPDRSVSARGIGYHESAVLQNKNRLRRYLPYGDSVADLLWAWKN